MVTMSIFIVYSAVISNKLEGHVLTNIIAAIEKYLIPGGKYYHFLLILFILFFCFTDLSRG